MTHVPFLDEPPPTAGLDPSTRRRVGRASETVTSLEQLLLRARSRLERVCAAELPEAIAAGGLLLDIREQSQRTRDGVLEAARFVPRNVLEWRCAPSSQWRDEELSDPRRRLILMCNEGYQSSLAAAMLQQLGLPLATDLIGGFQALRAGPARAWAIASSSRPKTRRWTG